ncbi:WAT1-related protein At3g30340-like [Triticum urartu]|uniref:WAT1-related protein n=1 Tax=Triticum urartu TaxID=4572 RepID=A0A8R7QVM5_TRIUA|nr:WAT1-related protein At3g30340-like [Triticum urartu]
MGGGSGGGGVWPVVVMVFLNAIAAVMVSLVKVAMNGGLDPLVLVTLQQLTAAIFLGPIAYFREGKARPRMTLEIFAYLFASAALGAALRQYMIFVALRYTTATFVTAFSNVAPVLTFLLAAATRSESLKLRTATGVAKLAGTLVSLAGAMVLTFYRGVPLTHAHHGQLHYSAPSPVGADPAAGKRWTLGTVAILGNCVCLSCWFLLHGRLARKYPYVYSCNAFMSTFSFLQVAAVGLCAHRSLGLAAWLVTSKFQILTILYAGVVGCGVSFVLLTWCIEKRGPVFVAAFIPVVQIIVSVMDFTVLHETLYLGSVLGSVFVIGGLYLLLWGKRQEALQQPPKIAEDDREQQQQQAVQHQQQQQQQVQVQMQP